ncbi:hypothetical protein CNMCM6936_005030 [Aspergillus lentulus]|nr:hypothetical protein CNMCM6069_005552 [Aspergillus lentulus]KAF4167414.1 hypothetical protein CNMCM6936_005030 [Aspergillus lentulus]
MPGATIVTTFTKPASTITVSGTITTLPGSTTVQTTTLPGSRSVETVSVTVVHSTTIFDTVTLSGSGKTITITNPAGSTTQAGNTVTVPGTTTTLSICPTLRINPTYTPVAPLPRNYTWGCPPGYLCKPKHTGADAGCNIEAGLPAESYVCSPDECIKSPPFIHDQYWGTPVESNEIRSTYYVSKDYFNLDPEIFGLNYSIFRIPDLRPGDDHYYIRSSRRSWSKLLSRASIGVSTVPGACYDECNDAALEVESTGKAPEICNAGSAFNVSLSQCEKCCNTHKTATSASFEQKVLPNFQQFLNFCEGLEQSSATTAAADTVSSTTSTQTSTATGTTSTQKGGSTSQTDPSTASTTPDTTSKATKSSDKSSIAASTSSTEQRATSSPSQQVTASDPTTESGATTASEATTDPVSSSSSGSVTGTSSRMTQSSSPSNNPGESASSLTPHGPTGTRSGSSPSASVLLVTGAASLRTVPSHWSILALVFGVAGFHVWGL